MIRQADFVPSLQVAERYAFFFDVDGTLAAIKPRPEDVSIPVDTVRDLERLAQRCAGAVALVSGRPVAELDALVAPLRLPVAGVHGAERRDFQGKVTRIALDPATVSTLGRELEQAITALPGTALENKGMAFALHYRQGLQHQRALEALVDGLTVRFPELVVQPGKCVLELKPRGVNKGAAINDFMQQSPFVGRIPVFIGDDLTDEAGFEAVNTLAGISIKVGIGTSVAQERLADVDAVHRWLAQGR